MKKITKTTETPPNHRYKFPLNWNINVDKFVSMNIRNFKVGDIVEVVYKGQSTFYKIERK